MEDCQWTHKINFPMSFFLQLKRLQGGIAIYRKKLPEKDKIVVELVKSREELKQCEQEMRQLEKAVEDAEDVSRLRLLPGDNPTHAELNQKIDKVEVSYISHSQGWSLHSIAPWCFAWL